METTADKLSLNSTADIISVQHTSEGQRLNELGFYPGKRLSLINSAPFGGPMAFELGSTTIALRRDEARLINVRFLQDN